MTIAEKCVVLLSANGGAVMEEHIREAMESGKHRGYELSAVAVRPDGRLAQWEFADDKSRMMVDCDREEVKEL